MRSKIRYDLLLKSQSHSKFSKSPLPLLLYQTAYKYIEEMRSHIVKPFKNICVHGSFPELVIPGLREREKDARFWVHSLRNGTGGEGVEVLDAEVPFNLGTGQQNFDLIISCLQTHHYDPTKLMQSYKNRLTPDGAVIGCSYSENTLKQLRWSFTMAQNERSGGISPKVASFSSIGELGHAMTVSQLKMPTIVVRDYEIQVQSVVDLFTILQEVGEAGILQGRRKGVFKDVLLAACAYYDSEFTAQNAKEASNKNVTFSLEMGLFIGWKQHESQPKPLSRRQVINNSFFAQMMKNDSQSKMYVIKEGNDEPEEVDSKELMPEQNQKDPKSKQ